MSTIAADQVLNDSTGASDQTDAQTALPVLAVEEAWWRRKHLWALLGITVLGFVLRFSFPSLPLLWGDDAYTVYRTHADYQSMLDILQDDGFTPLHYELYWLVGRLSGTEVGPMWPGGPAIEHSTGMTPVVVRFLPALFGSLMPLAMYMVAVFLVKRRTALVVALVSACSAYLLGYSRDMKMYMMLWFFSALSTGCLLWWFQARTRIAWLCWVAASLAACSSHMTGPAVLPLQLIFFLTRARVDWRESILFVVGLGVIVLGPMGYMTQFNRWAQQEMEDPGFEVEGLGWVVPYNAGRSGPDLLRYATSAYLFSWEWPKESGEGKIRPWILTVLKASTTTLLLLAALGVMPWRRKVYSTHEDSPSPRPSPPEGEGGEPWWRVFLWLGLWITIPIYFMYCRSMHDFASPKHWWRFLSGELAGKSWIRDGAVSGWFWFWLTLAAAAVGTAVFLFPRFRRAAVWLVPVGAGVLLLVCLIQMGLPQKGELTVDQKVERAFSPLFRWYDLITVQLVYIVLALLLPGLVVFYCGRDWKQRVIRAAQFSAVVITLWATCWGVYTIAKNKFDKEVSQTLHKAQTEPTFERQLARYTGPTLEKRVKAYVEDRIWQTIFMPRYVGFVWIAICIGLCTLYMRLPFAWLRYGAVGLFVAINLAQFGARLFAGTEPPLDIVANDVWKHDTTHNSKGDATAKVFVDDSGVRDPILGGAGHPGCGRLSGQQGKYYLGLSRGYWIHPSEWKRINSEKYFEINTGGGGGGGRGSQGLNYSGIAASTRGNDKLKQIIVWEKIFEGDNRTGDRLADALGAQWKRSGYEDFAVRFHWTWTDLYTYRRSVYVRQG